MSEEAKSYRQIVRSTSIIGGASVINILFGLLRVKVAALLLGPAGVGLIALFTNLVASASNVAGLGASIIGTRQIAEASGRGDQLAMALARRALIAGTAVLALAGAAVFWALRDALAAWALKDSALSTEVGWLAVAVGLSVAAAAQQAVLNGSRRVGDIALLSVGSAAASTISGIAALLVWGRAGVVVYVLVAPLAAFLLGKWVVSRLPGAGGLEPGYRQLLIEWKALIQLGVPFVVAGLAPTAGELVVRLLVQRELGVQALGHFQAAWAISMTYVALVLSAMGTDYYPRLAEVIRDHIVINRLVNEQIEVALLLAAPILLGMLGLAPHVIDLLYTAQFHEAVVVLRWHVLGDVLKVASWPLGFVLLASGASKTFMVTEWFAFGIYAAATSVLLPVLGLVAAGLAFLAMYSAYFALVLIIVRRRTGFRISRPAGMLLGGVALAAGLVMSAAKLSSTYGDLAGFIAATAFGLLALVRLADVGSVGGPLGRFAQSIRVRLIAVGIWRTH